MASLDVLFLVQAEGRGHLMQALALRTLLEDAGHRVRGVVLGHNPERPPPAFFLREIEAPVVYLDSPTFALDARRQGIRPLKTLAQTLRQAPRYRAGLRGLDAAMERYRPDVVINFFEPMGGLYYATRRPAVPMVCIAHQYLYLHPAYRFPAARPLERRATLAFIRFTAWGAASRLALSLDRVPHDPAALVTVLPPLLREHVPRLPTTRREDFLLVYLLNRGYADEIVRWHQRRPEIPLHCFWDQPQDAAVVSHDATLTFHRLDGEKFLAMMARCRGLVTTAGFESVAEAMYLGTPVLAVPVAGHFEQFCNSRDVARVGAGLAASRFDLDAFLDFLPAYETPAPRFRQWQAEGRFGFLREIEQVALPEAPFISVPA